MKNSLAIIKFAFVKFVFLLKDRGFKYSIKTALKKRKQFIRMVLMPKINHNEKSIKRGSKKINPSEKGLVSVVIPIFDRTWELKEAIDSVLNQTYKKLEIILVCDGSPIETIEVVDSYKLDERIKIFKYPDSSGNAVRGRNKGIKEALGEFIAFLDSDDIAEPQRLQMSVDFLNENSQYAGVYGAWEAMIDGSRKIEGLYDGMIIQSPDGELAEHLNSCIPCQSTVLIKSDVLLDVGGVNVNMKYREDHELWARINYNGYRLKSLSDTLVKLRLHSGNNELNFSDELGKDVWFEHVLKEYNTKVEMKKKICWLVSGLGISGGLAVILKHANYLFSLGHDVSLITSNEISEITWTTNHVPIYSLNDSFALNNIDILIATAWDTEPYLSKLDSDRYLYFVQSDERRFVDQVEIKRLISSGYSKNYEYFTEAYWIQNMFHTEFRRSAFYVPNGLDKGMFSPVDPLVEKGKRKRVLIEGPIDIPFKAVEDCYNAIKDLDCDIWIVSSAGSPKPNWRYDRFFEKVPQTMMASIYSSCDIFIKMSRIEGFFGPPLEAMACGCVPVVGKVTGWDEYIIDGYNALAVELRDIDSAHECVNKLINDQDLYMRLLTNGQKTVAEWPWEYSFTRLDALINRGKMD